MFCSCPSKELSNFSNSPHLLNGSCSYQLLLNLGEKPVFECKDDNTDCRSYRIWKDSKKTIRRYFLARYCFDTIFCRPDSTTLLSTTTASTTTDAAPSTTTATATTIAATATATPAASTTVTAAIASTTTGKLIANEITSDEAHISFTSSNNYTQAKPSTTFPVVDTNRNESATDISESIVDFNTTLSNQKYDLRVRH